MSNQMSEDVLSGTDGADPIVFGGFDTGATSRGDTEEDESRMYVEEVLRELEEITRHDALDRILFEDSRSNLSRKIQGILELDDERRLSTERRRDDRMKLLRGLGIWLKSCKRVHNLGLGDLNLEGFAGLSIREVETLMRSLVQSTVLRELYFSSFSSDYIEPQEDSSAYQILVADILRNAKNLEVLHVSRKGMLVPDLVHIAEALICNGVSNLRSLSFSFLPMRSEEDFIQLSKVLGVAHSLSHLSINEINMGKEGAQVLGETVALHKELKILELTLDGIDWPLASHILQTPAAEAKYASDAGCSTATGFSEGAVDCFLAAAFLGPHPNTSIRQFRFRFQGINRYLRRNTPIRIPRLGTLSHLLRRNSSVTELVMYETYASSCDLRNLFEALQVNRSIRTFKLDWITVDTANPIGIGFDSSAFCQLVEWIKSATHLDRVVLLFTGNASGSPVDDLELNWPELFKALASNSTLRRLSLRIPTTENHERIEAIQKEMVAWLRTTRLKQLWIELIKGRFLWGPLLRALRANASLEVLKLPKLLLGDDKAFLELMKLLQINSTLQRVHFCHANENGSRVAQVSAALRCKARQETYLAELRAAFGTARWAHPTCGRVFLCGNPMAGKTQLAHTMLQQGTPWYTRVMEKLIPRTRGIEIQILKNDESMQLSLWDLAGQDIFRALQEYLFPKLNKACIFLFLFSLYDREAKELKPNLEDALEEELLYWLKFITSSSQMTGFNLPTVMVVLTHKDKTEDISSEWALPVLEKLRKEFEDVLTIYPSSFFVNGRQKKDVELILTEVYHGFKDLFEQKLFMVPEACCHVSRFLLDWAGRNGNQPIVTYEKFSSLCIAAHPPLKDFLSSHSDEEKVKVIRAIASYLHDVGTVLEIPNQNVIVANPNWLTHAFLGSLIGTGKDFQGAPGKKVAPPTSSDGFLSKSQFERFVKENILRALRKEGYCELDFKMLQILMEGLDLCFEVPRGEETSRFFVPTLFNVEHERQLRWKRKHVKGDASYLGLRIRCKDQRRTSLSVGFFPKFQISLWREMIQRLSIDLKLSYDCKYNLISMLHDGHDVLVETDEDGTFVDILARSEKSKESLWMFVDKHIVQELYKFCAEAKGPPGVHLVVDVLRTECVRQLTECLRRKEQAVSREILKEKLKQSIREQGDKIEDNFADLYKHTWKRVVATDLIDECEAALDLLFPQDIREVREWIRFETTALVDMVKESEDILRKICGTRISPADTCLLEARSDVEELSTDGMSLIPEIPRFHFRNLVNTVEKIGETVKEMREDVKEVLVKMDELKVDLMRMTSQFSKAQKIAQDSSIQIFQHMDRLIGISDSNSQLPRRPYFTAKDASWSHRIQAKINVGDPLILHFACENRNGNHTVPDQCGFELIVGDRNRNWLRLILKNSVKALWCLLKVGLHVTTSLGTIVPDLQLEVSDSRYTSLATLSVSSVLDVLEPQSSSQGNVVGVDNIDDSSAQKAWQYLQTTRLRTLSALLQNRTRLELTLIESSPRCELHS